MKKYTIRVEPKMAQLIEQVYGRERQFSVNQSIPVHSMNVFLASCIEQGIVNHQKRLDEGNSLLAPDLKSALQIMDELLKEVENV